MHSPSITAPSTTAPTTTATTVTSPSATAPTTTATTVTAPSFTVPSATSASTAAPATTSASRPPAAWTTDEPPVPSAAVGTLVLAFAVDPVIRWVFPDGPEYLARFPRLVQALCPRDPRSPELGGVVDRGPADAGAGLWVRPGTELDGDEAGAIVLDGRDAARAADLVRFLEHVAVHHPERPHWYLPFLGVDPRVQGRGHGGALLRRGLARVDADGLPAYLEASSPRNRALYERHGFEVTAEIRVAGGPPLWPMWRDAR